MHQKILQMLCLWVALGNFSVLLRAETLDRLDFGNRESENAHALRAESEIGLFCSKIPQGIADSFRTGRQILPPNEPNWTSDGIFFVLKVDPNCVNYLTFSFRGCSDSTNLLILYVDGKQLGYKHLGDYDILYHGSNPAGGERPWFVTTCLPESVTAGRTELELELRMTGRIWGYGENFEQFQKLIDGPSVPFFEAAIHTEPFWEAIANENINPLVPKMSECPIRTSPGEEVLDRIQERVNRELASFLKESESRPLSQQKAEFLAKGWSLQNSTVFQSERVLPAILAAGDAYCLRQLETESLAWSDPGQYNSDWFGTGPLAETVIRMDSDIFQEKMNENLNLPDGTIRKRRDVWAELFRTGVLWEIQHRRPFTNQSMIIDWNIQRMNRALEVLDAEKALAKEQVLRYLYESMGLLPWLGSETEKGPARPYGEGFFQLTPKGLTRELGYVGSYGEVLDWGVLLYLSTCEFGENGELLTDSGDRKMLHQLMRMAHARSFFRYPAPDSEGFRAMRLETAVGWRDTTLVGPVLYGERTGKEGAATWLPWILCKLDGSKKLESLRELDDSRLLGDLECKGDLKRKCDLGELGCSVDSMRMESIAAFEQMVQDGQFFPLVAELLKDGSLRVSNVLIDIPAQYTVLKDAILVKNEAVSPHTERLFASSRLPMTEGQSDFTFTDETNGVVAHKNGNEILYLSLFWRARFGVNGLSKVHFQTPCFEHFATVRNVSKFTPMADGIVFLRPNWTNFGFRQDYGVHYPTRTESLHRDEALPVAQMPEFVSDFRLGTDNLYAGRCDYYELEYGDYFIAMNMSSDTTFFCERLKSNVPPQKTLLKRFEIGDDASATLNFKTN